jgi:L-asparaginase II
LSAPVVAEVIRNGLVESRHHGAVLAIDADGADVLALGDVDAPMFPRSCAKPLQTVGMLRAGWAPGDDDQVVLACASHSGEPAHIAVVRRLLASAQLDPADLDNTPDLPLDPTAAWAVIRAGGGPDALHQNCSGKHAAMLVTCVVAGWPTAGYRAADHPLQRALRSTIEELAGETAAAVAVDGCGAPLFALTLRGLARAFGRLVTAPAGSAERRVAAAMRAAPFLLGGTGRDVTALMTAVDGIVAKDGAEGVYAAAMPDGRTVTLKIDDGAGRARAPVMTAALRRLDVDAPALAALASTPVLGHGEAVGEIRATLS